MRLNGWQRLGVVASVAWAIGGGLWINSLVVRSMAVNVNGRYRSCLDARSIQPGGSVPSITDWEPCITEFMHDFPLAVANHWLYAAAYTALSIVVAWLVSHCLVAVGRWVRAGFG